MVEHPLSPDDTFRKSLLRAAKFIDEHVTQDDELLHALEDAFSGGSQAAIADAALNIVYRAEAKVWGGAR